MIGLSALERWIEIIPIDLRPYLPEILPCLNDYLLIDPAIESVDNAASSRQPTVYDRAKAWSVLLKKNPGDGKAPSDEMGHMSLQLRILNILGSLGGQNRHLITSETDAVHLSVAWDTQKRLKLALPLGNKKLDVYFDALLPRVVDLAEGSNDRQTKTAASELLHSFLLYMIGRNASDPLAQRSGEPTPFHNLYVKIFPAILRLATDVETVSRQVFEPLTLQMVRWFAGADGANEEAMALMDAITEGAGDAQNGALRDHCARCLAEYFKWAIKQNSKKQIRVTGVTLDMRVRRLRSLALHPSAYQRLSAASVFNHLYRDFREESSLVSLYAL
jgi:DNA-dependent protein kinase catalytic subunit